MSRFQFVADHLNAFEVKWLCAIVVLSSVWTTRIRSANAWSAAWRAARPSAPASHA